MDVPRFVSIMSGGELEKMATISGASIMRKKKKKKSRNRVPGEHKKMSTSEYKASSFGQQDIKSAIVNEEDE